MTQEEQVEEYLRAGNTLTRIECLEKFKSIELPRIVFDINQKYPGLIESEMIKGNGKRYAKYFIRFTNEPAPTEQEAIISEANQHSEQQVNEQFFERSKQFSFIA